MRSLCVFCGSRTGIGHRYAEAARRLGGLLAARGTALVYGGASVGIMGELADAVLAAGGRAIGVIPQALWDREVAHTGLTELHVVGSMHERKALMAELAEGFVALPGGVGTMEELFEVWTWGQLGLHRKPFGLLDVAGFYRPLAEFLDHMVEQGFLLPEQRAMVRMDADPERLLALLARHEPPRMPRAIEPEET